VSCSFGADYLIAVWGQIQIKREYFAFGEPVLETDGDNGLVQLGAKTTRSTCGSDLRSSEQQLGHLLRDGGTAFGDLEPPHIAGGRTKDCEGIDTGMIGKAPIFRSNGCVDELGRQLLGAQTGKAQPGLGSRLVEHPAIPIDDERRDIFAFVE
jgi:hypothetical protein